MLIVTDANGARAVLFFVDIRTGPTEQLITHFAGSLSGALATEINEPDWEARPRFVLQHERIGEIAHSPATLSEVDQLDGTRALFRRWSS